jgi:hypothetical protein
MAPPGGGAPPHIHHHEEESFYVLQGTLSIHAAGRTFQASPGDFVHIPRGTAHSFRNDGKVDAKMLVTVSPAGLEKFFEEAFYPATNRTAAPPPITDELMGRIRVAAARNGLEIVRPAANDDPECMNEPAVATGRRAGAGSQSDISGRGRLSKSTMNLNTPTT